MKNFSNIKNIDFDKTLRKFNRLVDDVKKIIDENKLSELSISYLKRLLKRLNMLYNRLLKFSYLNKIKIAAATTAFVFIVNSVQAEIPVFRQQTGTNNPFADVSGTSPIYPALVDIDDDGDLDLFVGQGSGLVRYYENTGTAEVAQYTNRTGGDNPLNSVVLAYHSQVTFVDIDDDGDYDCFLGSTQFVGGGGSSSSSSSSSYYYGEIKYYENTGTSSSATFTSRTGASNPFTGKFISDTMKARVGFVDIDNDGDYDAFVGLSNYVTNNGDMLYFENTGTASSATFTERTGGANPMNSFNSTDFANPTFADIDEDGDYDSMVGTQVYYSTSSINSSADGFIYYKNNGSNSTPSLSRQTFMNNPLVDAGITSDPNANFADTDADGDLDVVIAQGGSLKYFKQLNDDAEATSKIKEMNIPYTNVLRNSAGSILKNTYFSLKIGIYLSSNLSSSVYEETQTLQTDRYGVFKTTIGVGVIDSTTTDIDVSSGNYVVKVEYDDSSPYSSYTLMEQRGLLSLLKSASSSLSSGGEKPGDVLPFIDMSEKDGWEFTGKSEMIGEPDSWTDMSSVDSPGDRAYTQLVWTGAEVIIWGGYNGSTVDNTGHIYNPKTATWKEMSTTNAPTARSSHQSIWTGSEMIVWGGHDGTNYVVTGAIYNPQTDTWRAMSTTNAPDTEVARMDAFAVWTGSEMIVWGGYDGSTYVNTGAKYNPSTDTWTTISTTNAPTARYSHRLCWTGSEMIVWGGNDGTHRNTGAIYNPETNIWTTMTTTNAPSARSQFECQWTGEQMVVFGGTDGSASQNTGALYNPTTNSWTAITTTNAPTTRRKSASAWTGEQFLVWGGAFNYPGEYRSDGAMYNPSTDTWTSLSTSNTPSARGEIPHVWTGDKLVLWSGWNGSSSLASGGAILSGGLSVFWFKKE